MRERGVSSVVRPERVELPTFWFVAKRSIQLSYGRTGFRDFIMRVWELERRRSRAKFRCRSGSGDVACSRAAANYAPQTAGLARLGPSLTSGAR